MKSYLLAFKKLSLLAILATTFMACVKDVDINQKDDIVLSPEADVDLVIYQLDENDFKDSLTGALKTFISDTVRLEFLDDDYIQKDLTSVELFFKHKNTFPREIESKIKFLSETNQEQFSENYTISAGAHNDPKTIERTKLIENDSIQLVHRSIKMVVELEVQPNGSTFKGELDFASRGLFRFDFK